MSVCKGKSITKVPFKHFWGHIHSASTYTYIIYIWTPTSTTYPWSHMRMQGNILCTVEPQSYGLHSYGILSQPDADIEYIFGKYHQNVYKIGRGHQF